MQNQGSYQLLNFLKLPNYYQQESTTDMQLHKSRMEQNLLNFEHRILVTGLIRRRYEISSRNSISAVVRRFGVTNS